MLKKHHKTFVFLSVVFLFGLILRFLDIYSANVIVGFDQARDFFDVRKIIEGDLRIIGPTAGNNPNLHHGVAFLYYLIPAMLIGRGNPFWASFWNGIFNAGAGIILFFLAESLFKSKRLGLITAFLTSISYQFIQFSGWLSNPTVTLFTVPLFFYGLAKYKEGEKWGLILASLFLGLSIQFELFFLYLIPVELLLFLILKFKPPSLKTFILSLIAFILTTSTMILTEIKFKFAGILSILSAGKKVGGGAADIDKFLERFWKSFSLNLWPQNLGAGIYIGLILIGFILFKIIKADKKESPSLIFLFIYLFSPLTMLLLGSHNAPWFLIGLPPAIILAASFLLSRIKNNLILLPLLLLIALANIQAVKNSYGRGQPLLEPDKSAILSSQLAVIDYTYQKAERQPFTINTVTNPLYINALWAYHYEWYAQKKYGYLPTFAGGDQLPPYNTLPKENEEDLPAQAGKFLFLIIDQTPRIPDVYRLEALNWAQKRGKLLEEKKFGDIMVQTREMVKIF